MTEISNIKRLSGNPDEDSVRGNGVRFTYRGCDYEYREHDCSGYVLFQMICGYGIWTSEDEQVVMSPLNEMLKNLGFSERDAAYGEKISVRPTPKYAKDIISSGVLKKLLAEC